MIKQVIYKFTFVLNRTCQHCLKSTFAKKNNRGVVINSHVMPKQGLSTTIILPNKNINK